MIQQKLLDYMNSLDLKEALIVRNNGLSYDYNGDLYDRLNDVYKIIMEAIGYINADTSKEFVNNIERSISGFQYYIGLINETRGRLGSDFESQKNNIILSINKEINEIFAGTDTGRLITTFNFLRNDYFAKNSETIVNDMFQKWSNGENNALNTLLGNVEEKVKQATDKARQATESSEVLQEVKSMEGVKEIQKQQEEMTKLYENERVIVLKSIILLAFILFIYLLNVKAGFLIDNKEFALGGYYMYSQIVLSITIISFLSYILKLLVDQYRLSTNILNNLRHKGTIINSYKLLLRTDGSESEKNELNKLIIEKTIEHLFRLGDGTSFGKDSHSDGKILEKALDVLPKLK